MHPEENGAVADRFQSKPPECTAAAKLFTKWICELATKRKCFDHDAAGEAWFAKQISDHEKVCGVLGQRPKVLFSILYGFYWRIYNFVGKPNYLTDI